MADFPLLDRAADAVLFRSREETWTAGDFRADVAMLIRTLPDAPFLVNRCENRYWFAAVLAAGVLRGQPNLLTGDSSAASLASLARLYPGAVCVADRDMPAREGSEGTLPLYRLRPERPRVRTADDAALPSAIPGDRLAAVVFTSGTTGEPTAHLKPWGGLVERTRAAGARFGFTEDAPATVIGTVPPQHMYGFETTLLLPLHAAAAAWADTVFYPADVRAALTAAPAPAVLVTTPLHLRALADLALPMPPRMVISATAPLPVALAEAVEHAWNTEVHEIFGATEVGSIASRRTAREEHWTMYPGVSSRETTDAILIDAPFLEPRPLSDAIERLDAHRFRLIGRGGDLLKLGGRRASHAGLNHILTRIAGVEDGVFAVPADLDERPSARLTAVVVAPGLSAADILAALRGRIDPVFLPRRIVHVDALPRNPVGKLTSEALRALLDSVGRETGGRETGRRKTEGRE